MTIKELIDYVADIPFSMEGQMIRTTGEACPITATFEKRFGESIPVAEWREAAYDLGLSHHKAYRIVCAADGQKRSKKTEALRKVLVKRLCQSKN